MLSPLDLRGVTGDLRPLLPRPDHAGATAAEVEAVTDVLRAVREGGDHAVRELTRRFDGVEVDDLRVAPAAVADALTRVAPELREALVAAHDAIAAYHRVRPDEPPVHVRNGIAVQALTVPVARVGCYVPGGRAVYPSTVLMTATLAAVAGVDEVVLCVPPDRTTGAPPDAVLAAAAVAGVSEVYRVGGAQAIAAMAYGTESIRPVDVIVGPGNVYVATAQRIVAGEGRVGVPAAFAGPSEIVVIADHTAPVELAAIDIVVQAEHGPGGLAWLITWDDEVRKEVADAVTAIVAASPRRADIEATLGSGGFAVLVDSPEQAIAVANAIAPEHLQLMTSAPESLLTLVRNAGAVFCGPYTPASLGDYIAGPSHVLPTNGSARFAQALTVADFTKHIHVVTADQDAVARVAPHVIALAEAEGLPAHADSIRRRAGTGP